MSMYQKTKAAGRIKELREERNWTQIRMGEELNELIGRGGEYTTSNEKGMALYGVNGGQTVAQLETGRNIKQEIAFAYSEIFNVTLDYIYGRSDIRNPEHVDFIKNMGLSEVAVSALMVFKDEIIKMGSVDK